MPGKGWALLILLLSCLAVADAVPISEARLEGGNTTEPLPVVIWHGMGDTCCLPISMGKIKSIIEAGVPGVYVRSLMIGATEAEDQYNGFLMPIAKQLNMACGMVTQDPKLQGGFHAVGFSQGGLFLRVLAQTCAGARIANLVSVGGPQQGVFGAPRCVGVNSTLCETMRELLELGAYLPMVQNRLVQAQYWHDPLHHTKYVSDNIFLPKANSEGTVNEAYRARINALNKLVLVKFLDDTVVVPKDSEWFGFMGASKVPVPLEKSPLYTEDWIGLKTLNEAGKLILMSSPGDHLEMPKGYFEKNIMPFFAEQL